MKKLTEKQKRFVDYYCQSGNAEQSAISAGYSPKTARGHSHKLLQNVAIKSAISERNELLEDERIADISEIKQFWTSVFRSGEAEIKDQLRASELLAKTEGAFIDKVEHSGSLDISNKSDVINKYLKSDADDS